MLYFILGFLLATFLFLLISIYLLTKRMREAEGNIIKIIEVINTHTNAIGIINNILDKQNPEFFIK